MITSAALIDYKGNADWAARGWRETKLTRHALLGVAHVSFALYMAYCGGTTIQEMAARLALPTQFIEERIEAARLCVMAGAIVEETGTDSLWC